MRIKKTFFCLFAIVFIANQVPSQNTFINRVFQDGSGNPTFNPILNPLGLRWSKSITTSSDNLLTVGHTHGGSSEDVYVIMIDPDGNIIFEHNYDVNSAGYNDYGTDIYETASGDFLICGFTDNGTTNDYDLVIMQINSSGTLLNVTTRNGPTGKIDFGVSIIQDGSDILVAANSENTAGLFDYWVVQFNGSLSFVNENFYDYASLNDIAIGMEIDPGNEVSLIGASASSTISSDYAIAKFDIATLSFLGDARSSLPGVALDKALAYCRDGNNNTYITGQAWNGTNFDIKTVKVASNMTIAWTVVYDAHGYNDAANTMVLDPVTGDVIIGGFATKSNNVKEMICLRYNASGGSLITSHSQSSENNAGDAVIKKVCTNTGGDVYFVGGEKGISNLTQVVVGKIKVDGSVSWQRKISDADNDILPSDIQYNNGTIEVISVADSVTDYYLTTAYEEFEPDTATVYNSSGVPYWKKNELIIKFLPAALDTAAIDNTIGTAVTQFGQLSYFMNPVAYSQLTLALTDACPRCDLKAVKIFPNLPTTFTTTTSRLGEPVPIPDFWATLLVFTPPSLGLQDFCDALKTLPGIAAYAHPNYIGQTLRPVTVTAPPSATTGLDPLYQAGQQSLNNPTNHNVDINAEEAWQIYPEGGRSYIKCGVFDQGLDWSHEEFGYDGVNPASSKVKGCWDFWGAGLDLKTVPYGYDSTGHGTSCAGIIGAIRNNTLGIKGIAGGNDTLNNNRGVSLYGLKIGYTKGHYAFGYGNLQVNYLAEAIVSSALQNAPGINYDYELNLSNNSWIFPVPILGPPLGQPNLNSDTNIVLISEAIHRINRLNVTFVGAAGNDGMPLSMPVNLDDDWILAVSATGTDGNFTEGANCNYYSNYGKEVDICAPGSHFNITTTNKANSYWNVGGTSMSAPHVAGVAGLLMSYHNDTLNPYNNLSPEDVEQIIQRSASPMPNGAVLPNDSAGYGRLNAGAALRLIEKPCNKLWHFGTKYSPKIINKLQAGGFDTIIVTERWHDLNSPLNYLAKGKYLIQAYEIHAYVTHNLPQSDTIKAFWPRPSGSDVWEGIKNRKLRLRERDTILSCTNSQAHLRGYIYKIRDTLNQDLGWWPCDTTFSCFFSNSVFEYSILTSSCLNTNIRKETEELRKIKLFPNPTSHKHALEIETKVGDKLIVDMYDTMGRLLKRIYTGRTTETKTKLDNDVSFLPNSLYIYIIRINDEIISRKFIKE